MPYKDPAKNAACRRKWAVNNKEKLKLAIKRWRLRHPEQFADISRKWAIANPEKRRATNKKNPVARRESVRRYRARKRAAYVARIEIQFFDRAFRSWGYCCAYCGDNLMKCGNHIEWDHFVPLSRGGGHVAHNLVPACASCNRHKSARDPFAFIFDRQKSISK